MRSLIHIIAALVAPADLRPSFDDMLTAVHSVLAGIAKARTCAMLDLLTARAERIAKHYAEHPQTNYHVARLQKILLIRRCEMLGSQYPETEQA